MGERPTQQGVSDLAGAPVEPWDLKVAVCIPSTGSWESVTADCIANMVLCFQQAQYEGRHEVKVFSATGSILTDNRHRLIAQAAQWGATHALLLDADMTVPWDTIQVLLRHNQPVVAANCVRRMIQTYPTAWRSGEGYVYSRPESSGLEQVDRVGTAVMLIDMRVFEAIDLPYFLFEQDPESPPGMIGEDIYFCDKLKEAGIPLYIDHDLSKLVKHWGTVGYTMQMALDAEDYYNRKEAEN